MPQAAGLLRRLILLARPASASSISDVRATLSPDRLCFFLPSDSVAKTIRRSNHADPLDQKAVVRLAACCTAIVQAETGAGKDPSREKLVAALESMNNYDLGGFVIDYSGGKRAGSSFVDLSIISKTGRFLH